MIRGTMLAGILLLLICSCAPPVHRGEAVFDMTAYHGILWPGEPERPRIRYLWALQRVQRLSESKIKKVLAGEEPVERVPPQYSPILLRPQGIYVDEQRIYIADPGALRVTVVDRTTNEVFHILYGPEGQFLQYPISVVSDEDGRIYVSDADAREVYVYGPAGDYLFKFEGTFKRPTAIGIDRQRGILYVVDTLEHRIYRYDLSGKRTGYFGERGDQQGQFNYPGYIFVDANGTVYISDCLNFRVQAFDHEGRFLWMFGEHGDSYGTLGYPRGVAVDTEGHVYVVDALQDMVKIFDQKGRLLLFFGEKGHGYGQFYLPTGIFIDKDDIIYVADSVNMRIQAFEFLGVKK